MPEPINIATSGYVEEPPFFCLLEGGVAAAPWEPGKRITVGFSGPSPPPHVVDIVKEAIKAWSQPMNCPTPDIPRLVLVDEGQEAMVRIRCRPGGEKAALQALANTSTVGPACLQFAGKNRNTAIMALTFASGGARDQLLFSHRAILRNALHLLGHVLGLPHAKCPADHPRFKKDAVFAVLWECYHNVSTGDFNKCLELTGHDDLDSPDCIMHFDVPAALSATGKGARYGGYEIDAASRALLCKLYPPRAVERYELNSGSLKPSSEFTRKKSLAVDCGMPCHLLGGFMQIEWQPQPLNNFRVDCRPDNGDQTYNVKVQTISDTFIDNTVASWVALPKAPERKLECGRESLRSGQAKEIAFSQSYRKPVVVVALSHMDSSGSTWTRWRASATDVTSTGCKLLAETWSDTEGYEVAVDYLVHEADDAWIRSGRFLGKTSTKLANEGLEKKISLRSTFDSPLAATPRTWWWAFCYIDAPNGPGRMRIRSRITGADRNGIDWVLDTWEEESKWYGLDAVYVVIA